jgi:hypothetical protein
MIEGTFIASYCFSSSACVLSCTAAVKRKFACGVMCVVHIHTVLQCARRRDMAECFTITEIRGALQIQASVILMDCVRP